MYAETSLRGKKHKEFPKLSFVVGPRMKVHSAGCQFSAGADGRHYEKMHVTLRISLIKRAPHTLKMKVI